ncbi:MAG: hypothetical protein MHPSP_000372 [Paramarteilia canceri]
MLPSDFSKTGWPQQTQLQNLANQQCPEKTQFSGNGVNSLKPLGLINKITNDYSHSTEKTELINTNTHNQFNDIQLNSMKNLNHQRPDFINNIIPNLTNAGFNSPYSYQDLSCLCIEQIKQNENYINDYINYSNNSSGELANDSEKANFYQKIFTHKGYTMNELNNIKIGSKKVDIQKIYNILLADSDKKITLAFLSEILSSLNLNSNFSNILQLEKIIKVYIDPILNNKFYNHVDSIKAADTNKEEEILDLSIVNKLSILKTSELNTLLITKKYQKESSQLKESYTDDYKFQLALMSNFPSHIVKSIEMNGIESMAFTNQMGLISVNDITNVYYLKEHKIKYLIPNFLKHANYFLQEHFSSNYGISEKPTNCSICTDIFLEPILPSRYKNIQNFMSYKCPQCVKNEVGLINTDHSSVECLSRLNAVTGIIRNLSFNYSNISSMAKSKLLISFLLNFLSLEISEITRNKDTKSFESVENLVFSKIQDDCCIILSNVCIDLGLNTLEYSEQDLLITSVLRLLKFDYHDNQSRAKVYLALKILALTVGHSLTNSSILLHKIGNREILNILLNLVNISTEIKSQPFQELLILFMSQLIESDSEQMGWLIAKFDEKIVLNFIVEYLVFSNNSMLFIKKNMLANNPNINMLPMPSFYILEKSIHSLNILIISRTIFVAQGYTDLLNASLYSVYTKLVNLITSPQLPRHHTQTIAKTIYMLESIIKQPVNNDGEQIQ